jgi:ADP-heptose:LPS heptosyltransferase
MTPLIIEAHGGLGDQVCVEPTLRFIDKMWPHYEMYVITQYPELFCHIKNVKAYNQNITFPFPAIKACTHPKDFKNLDFQQIHTVDFISLLLLKMTLPLLDKQIKINVPQESYDRIKRLIPQYKNTVLIHPGKSWDSKSFPVEVWQSYTDILNKYQYNVAVVGKNYWANKHEYRGTVGGLSLYKCINLIDQLTLTDLCAALDMCPVLISNDSGPIHLSGAFNNHVGVISTVRRPETLFHWRNGIQGQRYYSLEKYRIYDRLIPDTINDHLTYNTPIDFKDALPTANDILTFVGEHI